MKNSELRVIKFDKTDVIATSAYLMTGLMNGVIGDATFYRYEKAYDTSSSRVDAKQYLTSDYKFKDSDTSKGFYGEFIRTDKDGTTEQTIINIYGAGYNYDSTYNGWYSFDSSTNTFTRMNQ